MTFYVFLKCAIARMDQKDENYFLFIKRLNQRRVSTRLVPYLSSVPAKTNLGYVTPTPQLYWFKVVLIDKTSIRANENEG